jgi:hypothetical protein
MKSCSLTCTSLPMPPLNGLVVSLSTLITILLMTMRNTRPYCNFKTQSQSLDFRKALLCSVGKGGIKQYWWNPLLQAPSHRMISLSSSASCDLHLAQKICNRYIFLISQVHSTYENLMLHLLCSSGRRICQYAN